MSDDEVREYLRSMCSMTVATHGPKGWPHLVPVTYGFLDTALVFVSFTKAQKIVNLRRDARLTCLVEDGSTEYSELRGVLIFALARLSEDAELALEASRAILFHKLSVGGEVDVQAPDIVEQLERFDELASKRTAVIVEPERVVSWDHRRLSVAY